MELQDMTNHLKSDILVFLESMKYEVENNPNALTPQNLPYLVSSLVKQAKRLSDASNQERMEV